MSFVNFGDLESLGMNTSAGGNPKLAKSLTSLTKPATNERQLTKKRNLRGTGGHSSDARQFATDDRQPTTDNRKAVDKKA